MGVQHGDGVGVGEPVPRVALLGAEVVLHQLLDVAQKAVEVLSRAPPGALGYRALLQLRTRKHTKQGRIRSMVRRGSGGGSSVKSRRKRGPQHRLQGVRRGSGGDLSIKSRRP
eukprot:8594181-Pyramimonas_sp.AAC.1